MTQLQGSKLSMLRLEM